VSVELAYAPKHFPAKWVPFAWRIRPLSSPKVWGRGRWASRANVIGTQTRFVGDADAEVAVCVPNSVPDQAGCHNVGHDP